MVTANPAPMLLVLPDCSTSLARVECVGCGGSVLLDLGVERLRSVAERLPEVHDCPGEGQK